MNKKSAYAITIVLCLGVLAVIFSFNDSLHPKTSMNGKDVWEYHTIGVNLSEFGKFPVMGFLGEPEMYGLDQLKPNTVDDYILCRFTQNGPVYHLEKPPVYGLLLGITYSILGPEMGNAYFLNGLFFIGILVCLFFIGLSVRHPFGPILGLVVGILYSLSDNHHLEDLLPSTLMIFLACCITLVALLIMQRFSLLRFIVLGVLLAVAPLTNGNLIFIVIFTPPLLYFATRWHPNKRLLFMVMALSFLTILIPWMVFANALRLDNVQNWTEWKNGITETEHLCVIDTTGFNSWESSKRKIVTNGEHIKLISHMYIRCANQNGLVIFSNQLADDELLSVHNEFNVDGNWHPEWRYRKSAIYHRHYLDKPFLQKILCFYVDNPQLTWKIAIAKWVRATKTGFSSFLFVAFLFGILLLIDKITFRSVFYQALFLIVAFSAFFLTLTMDFQYHVIYSSVIFLCGLLLYVLSKMRSIPFIFPLSILNSYLITFLFYGESRFVLVIEPLTIFLSLYLLWLIFTRSFLRNNPNAIPSMGVSAGPSSL